VYRPIPDDDLGRAFKGAQRVLQSISFVNDALNGRVAPPGGTSGDWIIIEAIHEHVMEKLPQAWRDLQRAFPEVRHELAGLFDPIEEGSLSGSSAHFIAFDIGGRLSSLVAESDRRDFIESVAREVNLARLCSKVEAEHWKARRAREAATSPSTREPEAGQSSKKVDGESEIPVLLPVERAVLDMLLGVRPGKGIVGADILTRLDKLGFRKTSQSYLTTDIIPKLRDLGVPIPNARGGRGYGIDRSKIPDWVHRLPPA